MSKRIPTVLFIGKGNSCRSIMAESILNEEFGERFMGFSAGSAPKGNMHPITIQTLKSFGYETRYLRSKSWLEFGALYALRFDFVITLCDTISQETSPILNGRPIKALWGIPDPAQVQSSETDQYSAFNIAYKTISEQIAQFAELPIHTLNELILKEKVQEIGIGNWMGGISKHQCKSLKGAAGYGLNH